MSRKNAYRPLVCKPTNYMERRSARIAMRIGREHAITRGIVVTILGVLRRGFFGRLKWALFGY